MDVDEVEDFDEVGYRLGRDGKNISGLLLISLSFADRDGNFFSFAGEVQGHSL